MRIVALDFAAESTNLDESPVRETYSGDYCDREPDDFRSAWAQPIVEDSENVFCSFFSSRLSHLNGKYTSICVFVA